MEDWDAQKMLDKYIHDYMIKNSMHDAADIFAEEANICLRPVAIDSKEGFLAEWWSLFWDVYSDILSKHPTATEGYTSKDSFPDNCPATQNAGNWSQNILPEMPRPDMNYMSQNTNAAMGMLGLPNQPQTVHLTAMPSPDMVNLPMTMPRPDMLGFLQSALPMTMQRPELNPYCLGSPPSLDFDLHKGDFLTNLLAASIHEQEHLMFPERGLDFNSQLLSVDQLARMIPSSSKYSYPLEIVPQKPQCYIFGNGGFCTDFPGSIAAQPKHHGESNLTQPKAEPADSESVGHCVTKGHCCCLELNSSTSSNSASSDPAPESKNLS